MLRTPLDSSGSSQPLSLQNSSPYPPYHSVHRGRSVRHLPSTTCFPKSSSVSRAEKRRIYDAWTSVGKPHNLICSQCRNPDDLIPCETCCRSYHAACLQRIRGFSAQAEPFHCPSCKRNQWDQSLQFDTPLLSSSDVSRSSTPSVHSSSRVNSPSGYNAFYQHRSMEAAGLAPEDAVNAPVTSPQQFRQLGPSTAGQPGLFSQVREFLMINGHFPANQEFPLELLSKLGSIMAAAESQNSLQDEIRYLKEENASLRNENANMRDYFNSKLPTREPLIATQASGMSADTPRAATDTEDKPWDRIMFDMI